MLRFLARLRGRFAHAKVDGVVGSFEKHVTALDSAVDGLNGEITTNAVHQYALEGRNIALRTQRERALKVRAKIAEFVV